jgi:hypothetical protein
MALFKRRTRQTEELRPLDPSIPPSWARRLGAVGMSLDEVPHEIRDVVVVTEGNADEDGALISLLGYRESAYHQGWTTIMYSLNTTSGDSQADHMLRSGGDPNRHLDPTYSAGEWERRFRGVGALLDRSGTHLRAVTVIDVGNGVLINATVPVEDPIRHWELRSIELPNERIEAAFHSIGTGSLRGEVARTT